MTTHPSHDSEPVSVAITRRVIPENAPAFDDWLTEVQQLATEFAGYQGMDVIRPTDASSPHYVIIVRFESHEHYARWHDSSERAEAVARSTHLVSGEAAVEEAHGLAGWFAHPNPMRQRPGHRGSTRWPCSRLPVCTP